MKLSLSYLLITLGLILPGRAQNTSILFIMTDDHSSHAISAYGSVLNQTPNLDRLAIQGMLFKNCFVTNSICTPSRATLLTGKYSHSNGVTEFNKFDGSQSTVAKMLQAAGYHTGVIGKWHLTSDPTGFDVWNILPGQGDYVNPSLYTAAGSKTYKNAYATDVITDLSLEFLKNRPKDKPFFLLCHHKAPHRNWIPSEKYRQQFKDKKFPEPSTLRDDYKTRTSALHENRQTVTKDLNKSDLKGDPPADLQGDDLLKWKYQRYMQDYLACVQSVDDNVGRLLDYLQESGLAQNTVVIYTSDNGFFLGDHGMYDKRFMYEHSMRIPFLVRWPESIKAGSSTKLMAANVDFAPTFLDIAGEKIPAEMQGRSLLPIFRGAEPTDWRTSLYYRYYNDPGHHHTAAHLGVRTNTQKLICFWKKNEWEFYDLVKDPDELHNLYNEPTQQDAIAKLKEEILRLKKELKDDDQFAAGPPKKQK